MYWRNLLQEAARLLRAPDGKSNRSHSAYLDLTVVLFLASLLIIQGARFLGALLTE